MSGYTGYISDLTSLPVPVIIWRSSKTDSKWQRATLWFTSAAWLHVSTVTSLIPEYLLYDVNALHTTTLPVVITRHHTGLRVRRITTSEPPWKL